MAGQRQPTDLVVLKGKKHLTKAEIEARKNAEIKAANDKVRPPAYLSQDLKKKFRKLAKELLQINLIANVDCDALARVLIAQDQYLEVTEQLKNTPMMIESYDEVREKEIYVVNPEKEKLYIIQDRCWKQCRQGAADFGLTVSSRCRIVVPKAADEKPVNKFAKYAN